MYTYLIGSFTSINSILTVVPGTAVATSDISSPRRPSSSQSLLGTVYGLPRENYGSLEVWEVGYLQLSSPENIPPLTYCVPCFLGGEREKGAGGDACYARDM